jgi:hypothetical protein
LTEITILVSQRLKSRLFLSRAIAQAVSHWLPTAAVRVRSHLKSYGICVEKVALGQVFSEYFIFPCQFSFHRVFHNHRLGVSSGAGTIGQLVADVSSSLSLTAPKKKTEKLPLSVNTVPRRRTSIWAVTVSSKLYNSQYQMKISDSSKLRPVGTGNNHFIALNYS